MGRDVAHAGQRRACLQIASTPEVPFCAAARMATAFVLARRSVPERVRSIADSAWWRRAAAVVLGGGGAVAAAGSLPAPVQSVVSSGLTHVGISVPNPNSHASPHASLRGGNANSHASPHASLGAGNANSQASGHGNSGSASSANAYGQCTAWAAANKGTSTNSNSSNAQDSFPQLTADAQAKSETIQAFCASVSPPSTVPTTSGSSDGSTGSGAPSGTPAGPPASIPSGSRSGAATTR